MTECLEATLSQNGSLAQILPPSKLYAALLVFLLMTERLLEPAYYLYRYDHVRFYLDRHAS